MIPRPRRILSFLLPLFLAAPLSAADLRVPAIIGDNMVLPSGKPAPIWGWAKPGDQVVVSIDQDTQGVVADKNGCWRVQFPAHASGGPFEMTVIGDKVLKFKNVVYGQIWVCSGQSNMEFKLQEAHNSDEAIINADHPEIHLFHVAQTTNELPADDIQGHWEVCRPATARGFSAVGYFFGKRLLESLHQPIGLIDSSWGGTFIQTWMSTEALAADRDHETFAKKYADYRVVYEQAKEKYDREFPDWLKKAQEAQAAGLKPPPSPTQRALPEVNLDAPAARYNAMIHPFLSLPLAGCVWYQGESNSMAAVQYRRLLTEMISSWRKAFAAPEMPFIIVQIATWRPRRDHPDQSEWAQLRESQAMVAAADPHAGLVVTLDLGDNGDLHPKNKQDVGKRAALVALKLAYGQDIIASGPTYDSMKIEDDKIRLRFNNALGLTTNNKQPVEGFTIAGADHKFYWAKAVIDGDDVVVSCEFVPKPLAVRYAWAENPACNLCNSADLPAGTFRTDDWKVLWDRDR